jgi:hypothetical protein
MEYNRFFLHNMRNHHTLIQREFIVTGQCPN